MSATGFTPISLYYSTTAGVAPTAGNLVAGELAINTQDGRLFYKDTAGVVQIIAGKGGAGVVGGSNTQVQYNSSGSFAGSANFVWDNSNTRLGIGTSSPVTTLDVNGSLNSLQARFGAVANRGLEISTALIAGINDGISILNARGANSGVLAFQTDSVERMRINATGTVILQNGTTTANGTGITFPSSQNQSSNANTLDDYETGTWTPTLSSDGTPPTVSSYNQRLGSYTKIGNLVTATCTIRATLSSAGTGNALVTGLPFSSAGYLDGVALGLRDILTNVNPVYTYVSGATVSFNAGYVTGATPYLTFTISYRAA